MSTKLINKQYYLSNNEGNLHQIIDGFVHVCINYEMYKIFNTMNIPS